MKRPAQRRAYTERRRHVKKEERGAERHQKGTRDREQKHVTHRDTRKYEIAAEDKECRRKREKTLHLARNIYMRPAQRCTMSVCECVAGNVIEFVFHRYRIQAREIPLLTERSVNTTEAIPRTTASGTHISCVEIPHEAAKMSICIYMYTRGICLCKRNGEKSESTS